MCGKKRGKRAIRQFVGEIETEIVDLQYHDAKLELGEQVNLEREPSHPLDRRAIRVENGRFQIVGYLPRHVSSWLTLLLDAGKAYVEGYVPNTCAVDATRKPFVLMVFLSAKGLRLLKRHEDPARLDASQSLVLTAYESAQSLVDPQRVLDLVKSLEPLASQDLLPETRLLLALIPGVAREVLAARSFQTQAVLQTALAHLRIGEPVFGHGLTVFPLFHPEEREGGYVLLARAMETGTAKLEEFCAPDDTPGVRLHNKCLRPILVPGGELLFGSRQVRVTKSMLVPAKSTVVLVDGSVEHEHWAWATFDAPRLTPGAEPMGGRGEDTALAPVFDRFRLPEGASGLVVGRGGQVRALHLFDRPSTMVHLQSRVLTAHICESSASESPAGPIQRTAVEAFLQAIFSHARIRPANPAPGEQLEIRGPGIVGGGLIYDSQICHLAAFADREEQKEP